MSQADLESTMQLGMSSSTSASWDYRNAPSAISCAGDPTQGLGHARQAVYQLSQISSAN